jgi:hypothetical protein
MKPYLNRIEKIAAVIAAAAFIFKLSHYPLSGMLLVLSLSTLAIIYFFSANNKFKSSVFIKEEDENKFEVKDIFSLRLTGYGLSILLIGILFTLQFWPRSRFLLIMGLGSILIAFISIQSGIKIKFPELYKSILQRIIIFGAIGIVLFTTPKEKLYNLFHWDKIENLK